MLIWFGFFFQKNKGFLGKEIYYHCNLLLSGKYYFSVRASCFLFDYSPRTSNLYCLNDFVCYRTIPFHSMRKSTLETFPQTSLIHCLLVLLCHLSSPMKWKDLFSLIHYLSFTLENYLGSSRITALEYVSPETEKRRDDNPTEGPGVAT